jgi:hypothetical protein
LFLLLSANRRKPLGEIMKLALPRIALAAFSALGLMLTPVSAQMTSIDPNSAIDSDLDYNPPPAPPPSSSTAPENSYDSDLTVNDGAYGPVGSAPQTPNAANSGAATVNASDTYKEDDLIGAAEGVFGKGAQGLAGLIEDVLKKQGEPNAYIVGREAGGALAVGLRYGSGTLYHKVEGQKPAYWTGPSIGFDAGANAGNTFILVYNLFDSQDLYKRFGAGEGAAYLIGGFNVSYMRRGDVVLIPIRVGVGARLGANIGYMKFRPKQSWMPF